MQLAKMCRAVGQNVCTICVLMAMLCPGGDTRSRQPLKELGDAMGKATPVSMGHNVSNQNIHSVLEDAISEKSKFFLKKLFQKYGTNGSMTFEGFEHFLENLGLANIRITDHDLLDHKDGRGFKNLHSSDHSHAVTWPKDFKSHDHSGEQQNVPNIDDHSHFKQDSHLHEDHSSQQKDLHDHSHDHHNNDHSRRKRQVHKLKSSYSKLYSTKNAKHSLTRVKRQESHGHESHSSHEHDHGSHDGHELHDHGSPDPKSTNGHDSLDQKSNDDHESHDEHKSHDHDHAHSDELHGHLSDNNDPLSHQDQKEPRGSDAKLAAVPNTRNRKKPGRKRGRKRGGSRKKVTDKSLGGTVSPSLQQMMWDKVCPDGICDQQCLSARELLVMFNLPPTSSIEEVTFLEMCPVLMYQLDSRSCRNSEKGSLGKKVIVGDHSGHDHSNRSAASSSHKSAPAKVWGYSVMAVLIVSAVGLLSVAIIPIIGKVFYNHLLQFLVALAVGALSGDALLHLIPHAIEMGSSDNHAPHGQEDSHGHDSRSIWIGLMALAGIYIFFMLERVVTIITEIKNKNKQNKKRTSPVYLDKEGDFSRTVGAKLSGHVESCEEMVMVVHPNKALKEYAKGTTLLADCEEDHENEKINNEEAMPTVTYEHGHGHGHSHEVPTSVAALAWMVILGDGIHNFTDGLAIGAAFSSSITGGISTTIAIFCHELPHEIGDFAVLLRAGMSVKRALVYNCVSSVLCLIGMVIGVPLGNLDNASVWIFAMVGGMFIYIAFVDMLPEMTAVGTKKGEHPFCHLAFQVFGLLCGAGIMLLIAIYEHDIKTSLEP